jgi:hypothetical protein
MNTAIRTRRPRLGGPPDCHIASSVKALLSHTTHNTGRTGSRDFEEPPLLQPSLFAGLTVIVSLSNKDDQTIVTKALSVSGAKVTQSAQPDLIVTDLKDPFLAAQFPGKRSPRIIQTQQIPWALARSWPKPPPVDGPLIVVADTTGKSRPCFAVVYNMPTLNFDRVPKGYTISPFVPIPADFEKLVKYRECAKQNKPQFELPDGPADNGYCELCNCSFDNGGIHRTGPDHRRNATNPDTFVALDDVIGQLKFTAW